MITQKAISLKVNKDILAKLDFFCKTQSLSRNKVINDSIVSYLATRSIMQSAIFDPTSPTSKK